MAFLDETGLAEVWSLVKGRVVTYSTTIAKDGWAYNTNGYYYANFTVDGILATDNPIVDFKPSATDYAANIAYADCMARVLWITTDTNMIVVRMSQPPTANFPIQLKVVR